jgi:hypothetical protein
MMKAVILGNTKSPMGKPEPYSWFVLTYTQGLRLNGVEVHYIDWKSNSLQNIKQKIISIKPDIVFTHLSFHFNLRPTETVLQLQRDIIKATGTRFIHVTMDARQDDRYMGNVSDAFHMAFVGNFEMLERGKKAWGIPAYYSPYASLNYDRMANIAPDLMFKQAIFTGGYATHPDRKNFLDRLSKRIPIKMFATQSAQDLRNRTPELSVSSKCILGLCTGYNIKGYNDVRFFQYLGTGACFIGRRFTNTRELFPDDVYWGFDGYGNDAVDKVSEFYQRSIIDDTTEMRKKAFDFVQKHHSAKVRMKDIVDAIYGKEIPIDEYYRR